MKIAIIGGSGKMGQWFARFLAGEGNDILLVGRSEKKLREINRRLAVEVSVRPQDVATADLVIVSVPMDSLDGVLEQYAAYIAPGQTVIDITSVKSGPVEAMHRHLKTDKVLGAHPMFGPGAKDFSGHNVVLTPTNETEKSVAAKVQEYVGVRGGKVSVMTPEDHDRMMAIVLGLPHIIALVSADTLLGLGKFEEFDRIGGTTCKLLLMFAESVLSEDPELYASLQMNLKGMSEIYEAFQGNMAAWADIVRTKDKGGFIKRMESLRQKRAKSDEALGAAYSKMYRALES